MSLWKGLQLWWKTPWLIILCTYLWSRRSFQRSIQVECIFADGENLAEPLVEWKPFVAANHGILVDQTFSPEGWNLVEPLAKSRLFFPSKHGNSAECTFFVGIRNLTEPLTKRKSFSAASPGILTECTLVEPRGSAETTNAWNRRFFPWKLLQILWNQDRLLQDLPLTKKCKNSHSWPRFKKRSRSP